MMQFKDVIGQKDTKQLLLKMVGENRIPHAMLFMGNIGSGTLPLAIAFAQLINCENAGADDSCGICYSCRMYAKLTHPDLHFALPVNTTDDIKKPKTDDFIEQWRSACLKNPYLSLQDWYDTIGIKKKQGIIATEESAAIVHKLYLKSFEGKHKVLIMWHADRMNSATSNKLLKIIEEPPGNTVFILITERYDGILPTILSRTQLVKIPKIDNDSLTKYACENYNININKARNMVHLSGNDITELQVLMNQENLSGQMEHSFIEWMRMCWLFGTNYKGLYSWIEDISKLSRDAQKNFLNFSLGTVRECLITNMAGINHSRYTNATFNGFEKFSMMINAENIEPFAKTLEEAIYHIERNANPKILFLDLSFRMHRILHMKL